VTYWFISYTRIPNAFYCSSGKHTADIDNDEQVKKKTKKTVDPVLLLFEDGTSLIHEAGMDHALRHIRKVPTQNRIEAPIKDLKEFKAVHDKIYQMQRSKDDEGKPTDLDRAIAELKQPKPCVLVFNDKSAAYQPLGHDYAESLIQAAGHEWIGYVSYQTYEDEDMAQDICTVHNNRCPKTSDTLAKRVMEEVFGEQP
jgi:hypothetical protein